MTNIQPEVAIILSIASICISLIVAITTWLQAKINRNKLRLDLYNKRFEIYSNTLEFFQALISHAYEHSKEDFNILHNKYIKSYRESLFLFNQNDGIYKMLEEIHAKSFKITGINDIKEQLQSSPTEFRIKVYQESLDAMKEIGENICKLETAMDLI